MSSLLWSTYFSHFHFLCCGHQHLPSTFTFLRFIIKIFPHFHFYFFSPPLWPLSPYSKISLIDVKEHDISFLSLSHDHDCNDDQAVLPRVWLLPALRNLAICLHGDNFTFCFTTMFMIMMASTSPSLTLSWSIGHDDGTDFTKITLSSLFSDLCHINITSASIISMIFTWSWSGSWLMQSAFILYGDQVGGFPFFHFSFQQF